MNDAPTPEFSYQVRRGLLKINVTSQDGFVNQEYSSVVLRWRRKVPINTLRPYAVISNNRYDSRANETLSLLSIVFGTTLLLYNNANYLSPWQQHRLAFESEIGTVMVIAGLLFLLYTWIHRDLVWATWSTPERDWAIYFFAGSTPEEFERAVIDLETLILTKQGFEQVLRTNAVESEA